MFGATHTNTTCKICHDMVGSSYRDRKNHRERLLKLHSPGRWSLAQSLVSVVTGGKEPSESGESEAESVPQSSSGSSTGSLRSLSTHSQDGEKAVAECIPPAQFIPLEIRVV